MSVCVLLFCNMIAGILLLCAKDEDFYPNMNNGYNPNMNNGYNPNMNNGYNNANYSAPVNNYATPDNNNNGNNNGVQQ